MAGKKRTAALAAKRASRKAAYATFRDRTENDVANPNSKYGQRRRARMNGAPMTSRTHETPPWWSMSGPLVFEQQRFERRTQKRREEEEEADTFVVAVLH